MWRRMQGWDMNDDWSGSDAADMVIFAIWMAIIMMWVMTGLRIFTSVVLFKFAKEGLWIQTGGNGANMQDSHPCRQNK